jgi:hypothetical protein
MNIRSSSPASVLGLEITAALDRSLETSLRSLSSLRSAVRKYTTHSRECGVPLHSVIRSAETILYDAEEDRVTDLTPSPSRDIELAKQLRQWCKDDFGVF